MVQFGASVRAKSFDSVRACSARMFVLCLTISKTTIVVKHVVATNDVFGCIKISETHASTLESIEASEENRVIRAIMNQVVMATTPAIGFRANMQPIKVATPLPPLNLKNIGYTCPKKAHNASKLKTSKEKPAKCLAAMSGKKPFKLSPNKVNAAMPLRPERSMFVVPGFFEP